MRGASTTSWRGGARGHPAMTSALKRLWEYRDDLEKREPRLQGPRRLLLRPPQPRPPRGHPIHPPPQRELPETNRGRHAPTHHYAPPQTLRRQRRVQTPQPAPIQRTGGGHRRAPHLLLRCPLRTHPRRPLRDLSPIPVRDSHSPRPRDDQTHRKRSR